MEHRNVTDDRTPRGGWGRDSNLEHQDIYVRRVTAAALESRGCRCQGLHNAAFLPYGSSHLERLAHHFAVNRLAKASNLLPPRREDECIGY